jgi:drug/metabolite transporter (DMT)-like permease
MTRLRADALLLFVAVIWGAAFVAQKIGNETLPPLWFVALRFSISAIVLAIPAYLESRCDATPMDQKTFWIAVVIGVSFAVGACLQQTALVTSSATNGGFLTALYVVLVPLTTWLFARQSVRPVVLLAGAIAMGGAYLLGAHGEFKTWSTGDTLLIVSDFAWATGISLIAVFLARANRPLLLNFGNLSITAVVALTAAFVIEGPLPQEAVNAALPALLYTAVLSGGLGFSLQIIAQRYTPAPEAALIMSLESVFAAIAGALWLGEQLTPLAALGCALILLGVVIAEIRPTRRA